MEIVASVADEREFREAIRLRADRIEIRIDRRKDASFTPLRAGLLPPPPLVITCRSREEGGAFQGSPEEWYQEILPWMPIAQSVDIEQRYSSCAPLVRDQGKEVIASWHHSAMPSLEELSIREHELRRYGDLPKLVVTPSRLEDLLTLLSFTLKSPSPICVGVQGPRWRFGRVLLPLFGSSLAYCHVGEPAAEGQYHLEEFRMLLARLSG
jgi:3-dehydroquinate dehydratase-1